MVSERVPDGGGSSGDAVGAEISAAATFALLWAALVDLLGASTAAVLLCRAARRAEAASPELAEFVVLRGNLDYRYSLPPAWSRAKGTSLALGALIAELRPLLAQLMGEIAIRRLAQIPELRERFLSSSAKLPP